MLAGKVEVIELVCWYVLAPLLGMLLLVSIIRWIRRPENLGAFLPSSISRGISRIRVELRHGMECLLLLLFFLLVAYCVPTPGQFLGSIFEWQELRKIESVFPRLVAWGGIFGLLLLGRWTRSRWICLGASIVWSVGYYGIAYRVGAYSEIQEIRADWATCSALFGLPDSILLPAAVELLRIPLLFVWVMLGGLYAARQRYSLRYFLPGALITAALGMFLLAPWLIRPFTRVTVLNMAAAFLAALVVMLLPLQRRNLLRLFRIPAEDEPPTSSPPGFSGALFAHLVLALLVLGVGLSAVHSHYEKRAFLVMTGNGGRSPVSGSQVNAYEWMRGRWMKKKNTGNPFPFNAACSDNQMPEFWRLDLHQCDAARSSWEKVSPEKAEEVFGLLKPFEDDLRAALQADELVAWNGKRRESLNLVNLREVSRALGLRALYRIHQNKPQAALDDIELVLNLGCLMRGEGFVKTMFGAAIREIAVKSSFQYACAFRGDRKAMAGLAALFERYSGRARQSFPFENLARYDLGIGPVNILAPIITPGFVRSIYFYYRNQAWFDELWITSAIERYRVDKGRLPENLDVLVPEYLPRPLRDPFEGKPYVYEPAQDSYTLRCGYLKRIGPDFSDLYDSF